MERQNMAKAETEVRQGRPSLAFESLAAGETAPQTPRPGALFSLKAVGAGALRAALGCVGGAAAFVALSSGVAHAGQPTEPQVTDANSSGAPLAVLVSANVDAAEDNDPPEALAAPKMMRVRARLQCVPYARDASGVDIRGNANTWWRQASGRFERSKEPDKGAVIVMRGYNNPNRGHVAVVREVLSQRSILIDHANWLNSGEITVNVPVVDVSPNNDWSQVRVWHIPTQSWGVRVYNVQGFILPQDKDAPQGAGPTYIAR